MNNCAEWEEPIALWVEGDGGEGVDQHLAQCPACRQFAAELRESQRLLHALADEPLPVGVVSVPRRRWFFWWWGWPVFAAACALWLMMTRPLPTPEPLGVALWRPPAPVPGPAARPVVRVARPPLPLETNFIRMETDDENVVIIWIADTEGDRK